MTGLRLGDDKPATEREVLIRLRAAVIELIDMDEESGGAIDLSLAIEHLQRAIRELESSPL
jgi:hypothetical protein